MFGILIQERDSNVVGKHRGGLRYSVLNRESSGVPENAVGDGSLHFPAFCNAHRKTFSVWTKLLVCIGTRVTECTCLGVNSTAFGRKLTLF